MMQKERDRVVRPEPFPNSSLRRKTRGCGMRLPARSEWHKIDAMSIRPHMDIHYPNARTCFIRVASMLRATATFNRSSGLEMFLKEASAS